MRDAVPDHRRKIDRLVPGGRPRVDAGQREQVVDQIAEAVVRREQPVQELVPVDRIGVAGGHLQKRGDAGQRRTQLMGGIGDELALLPVCRLEHPQHFVEGTGEAADLVQP